MLRALSFLTLLAVAACTDGGDYPRLLPTQQILAEPALPDHAGQQDGDALRDQVEAKGATTRAQADPIPDPVDAGDLAARAADLRRRAEALRNDAAPDYCTTEPASPDCPEPAS